MNKSILYHIKAAALGILLSYIALFATNTSAQTTADIIFDWDEAECDARCVSVDGYRIYAVGGGLIVDTGIDPTTGQPVTTPLSTAHTVTNYALTVGVEQCFTVAAYNSAGESAQSDPACGILDQSVPSKTTLRVTFPVI